MIKSSPFSARAGQGPAMRFLRWPWKPEGGYGGTMLAAAKGAAEASGEIIGVTCSAFKSSKANNYVTREIVTGSLDERLDTLVNLGRAYIVLPGGTGTLLELAKVWELKNKGFLNMDKPIILLGGFWKPLVELIAT
ncbi:MAG: LOG family protein, partial [Planctomycetota bacterium]